MQKIGHRGAKGYVAENTLASFQKALDYNVDAIELDVHLSSDGQIMVIHDETIDRTSSKTGFVYELHSFYLKELGVPTLEDVLILVNKKCIINIEIKVATATQKVLQVIEKYVKEQDWQYNQFQISSFMWETLELVSKYCISEKKEIGIGVLTEDSIEKAIYFGNRIKAQSINPYFKLLNAENIKLIHSYGFKIFAWTVNTPEDLIFVKSFNVDGIISDFPDRI
jgi:glycerophosphoryl diester phosphodiesterase